MTIGLESDLGRRIQAGGIIAVLVIDREEDGPPLARALLAGGVDAMELTLRTPAALPALGAIRREVPEMLAGIGTILTREQVDAVVDGGGAFGVSPGLNPRVVERAGERGLPFAPGIMTPSDIERAVDLGCRLLKYFPAESSGGLTHLKSMAAPYQHLGVRYMPLGGIKTANLAAYVASPLVAAVGGSWLAPREQIKAHQWETITATAREAVQVIADARSGG